MKSYLDRVRSDPKLHIQKRSPCDKLLGLYPRGEPIPIMYIDTFWPSYANSMLFGLEFDFLMLEALIIGAMDRARFLENDVKSGLVLGVLIAWMVSSGLAQLRVTAGRRNIARHTLVDDGRFLFS